MTNFLYTQKKKIAGSVKKTINRLFCNLFHKKRNPNKMDSGWDIILNIFINKNGGLFTEEIFINGNNNEIMITKKLFKTNAK